MINDMAQQRHNGKNQQAATTMLTANMSEKKEIQKKILTNTIPGLEPEN